MFKVDKFYCNINKYLNHNETNGHILRQTYGRSVVTDQNNQQMNYLDHIFVMNTLNKIKINI
jgi:hypothetical protein